MMAMIDPLANRWIILRMAGPRTLAVVESLNKASFDVWTPVGTSTRRHRSKRLIGTLEPKNVPVMPTYAFARATHLHELIAAAKNPMSNHPDFSVFRWGARIPLIADRHLNALRVAEQRERKGKAARTFAAGDLVRVVDGPAAGMSGVVERAKGKFALVVFPGCQLPIDISTFLLSPESAAS